MNVLVIGSGAREHAITRALSLSKHDLRIYCCGTSNNPGIEALTTGYWTGDITDTQTIKELAQGWHINIAIIGPEAPLEKGMADVLADSDIQVIGPKKLLAQIESSKAFARDLMAKYNIPGLPQYKIFNQIQGVAEFLDQLGEGCYVIKANGLMGGKGVKVAGDHLHSFKEALAYCQELFENNHSLVIEEKLIGQEFSLMCFSDGTTLVPMPIVQDNKRAYVEDMGPNTGGMGSYSTTTHSLPFLNAKDVEQAMAINSQVIKALQEATKEKYLGILYGGFIATAKGVYVIEFNSRFGDPESLNVLSILESDFMDLCLALVTGTLNPEGVVFASKATVCKYAVPVGYPDNPLKNVEIDISAIHNTSNLYLGAVNEISGKLYATGSRTAAFVGVANTLSQAEQIAEIEIASIKGPLFHREDIGRIALINKAITCMRELRPHD